MEETPNRCIPVLRSYVRYGKGGCYTDSQAYEGSIPKVVNHDQALGGGDVGEGAIASAAE